MARAFHFIAGLPRSGSTLLAAILRQNPRLYAHMSSPLAPIFNNLQGSMGPRSEFYPIISDERRVAVLRGVFENYYSDLSPDRVVFDTNRMWTGKLSSLTLLHPNARVLCCVRPLPQIINSFEKSARKSPYHVSRVFNCNPSANIYTRVDLINAPQGALGLPYGALKEAFFGPYADRLLIIPYDVLIRHPYQVINAIYAEIGEDHFEHDFTSFEMQVDEFDRHIGLPGLHRVSGPIRDEDQALLLPPDIIHRFQHSQFWADPKNNPRGVQVLSFDSHDKVDVAI